MLALGHGQTIVQGGAALQFSPADPEVLPQFGNAKEYLRFTQSRFLALDMSRTTVDFHAPEGDLVPYELDAAEEDGLMPLVGSVYSGEDDAIRDNLQLAGPRVITFAPILKYGALPLAPALSDLLAVFADGLGCPVEMEFAVDVDPVGMRRGEKPVLNVLQVRPQATQILEGLVDTENLPAEQILCHTDRSLGHGVIETIQDVVIVKRNDLGSHETPAVAREVGRMNERLFASRTPYLLVGPGRWGSSDARLGIPVKWAEINGAKVIIETSFQDRAVEPSQGAHFFHNVTSFRIGYLTLFHADRAVRGQRFLDQAWLERQTKVAETAEVVHVRLPAPLRIYLDGRHGTATILKPAEVP
jgi:hypothetical protein